MGKAAFLKRCLSGTFVLVLALPKAVSNVPAPQATIEGLHLKDAWKRMNDALACIEGFKKR